MMLNIGASDTMRPVAFASAGLANAFLGNVDLGRKLWIEPAGPVMNQHRQYFLGGHIVFFRDKHSINRFVNEPDFIPVESMENIL